MYELFVVLRGCGDCDVCERAAKLSCSFLTDLDESLADKLIQFRHFVQNENLPASS